MFSTGMGPMADTVFSLGTMLIAIPTGVKIFNWIGTVWGGSIQYKTPMYFALGFVAMFIIGGLSGVMHASPPADLQQTDSYFIVAHFHYVLFGGSIFALTAGAYYWFPKMTGRMLSESLGKVHFWLMFLGFNLTFAPMHILGLNGMPRRVYTYSAGMGFEFWNADRDRRLPDPRLLVPHLHLEHPEVAQERRGGPGGPVARRHAGMVHPVAAAGVELRGGADGGRPGPALGAAARHAAAPCRSRPG